MSENRKRLDFSKMKLKKTPTPTKDALRDITPMPWKKEVLDGKRQISVSRQK